MLRQISRLAGVAIGKSAARTGLKQTVSNAAAVRTVAGRRAFHATAAPQKIIAFNLPDIGEGIAEVEVLKWEIKEGDKVSQFDKLVDVQSDKATVEITSRYDGIIKKIHHKVGEMAPTGKPLLDIEVSDDVEGEAAAPAQEEKKAAAAPAAGGAGAAAAAEEEHDAPEGSLKALATPAVRRLAREHNLSISSIRGTGKDGRVSKEDILNYIARGGKNAAAPAAAAAVAPAAASKPHKEHHAPAAAAAAPSYKAAPLPQLAGADTHHPVKGIARAMVKSMTAAWAVPHFGYCDEIHMDNLAASRASLKEAAEKHGLKFSYLPLILKATSLALRDFPSLNAHIAGDASEVVHRASHNIGVAMDTPRGLIVPNVKQVQDKSLLDIAAELSRLQSLAAEGKLSESDLSGGTFTLSNIGTVGGTYASPVLFVPQVAIGAIGKIQRLPRLAGTLPSSHPSFSKSQPDSVVPASIMTVSWAGDHRVVDGATLARFSNAWKHYLENPAVMMAYLR